MKQLIKFVIFILIIYLIYLIYNHLKNTEENFNNIIEVHFQEQDIDQTLYKIDLSSPVDNNITIDGTMPFIPVKNIIALFPISDTTMYMLDSLHQLFKVVITSSSASSIEITGFLLSEYPVKVVGNSDVVYVLTSKGNVYLIDNNNETLTLQRSINAIIDIALTSNGTLCYLNKEGILSSSSAASSSAASSSPLKFIQIICSGDTVFGLSTDKNIYNITANNSKLTSSPLNSINIQLISSDSMFGYIDDSNIFYFMENDNSTLSNLDRHLNVKQASFNESGTHNHRRIVLETNNQINKSNTDNGNLEPITVRKGTNNLTIQLFAGVNMNNIFVLVDRISGTPAPAVGPAPAPAVGPAPAPSLNCPDCNICTETTFDDCDSIFMAIKSLITGDSSSLCQIQDIDTNPGSPPYTPPYTIGNDGEDCEAGKHIESQEECMDTAKDWIEDNYQSLYEIVNTWNLTPPNTASSSYHPKCYVRDGNSIYWNPEGGGGGGAIEPHTPRLPICKNTS